MQDVVPTLETNYSGIKEVLDGLVRSYKGKEDEFGAFQKEYGIQVSCIVRSVSECDNMGWARTEWR